LIGDFCRVSGRVAAPSNAVPMPLNPTYEELPTKPKWMGIISLEGKPGLVRASCPASGELWTKISNWMMLRPGW